MIEDNRMTDKIFSERLKKALDSHKMTQMELSRQTGLSFTTINTMYRGLGLPNGYSLLRISTVLNVSADYLLGLSNVMERQ